MKTNILYLREMGMDDKNINTDLQNHRVRVLENIDIIYKGTPYNMFFEFTQATHYNYRTTNKRTGAPLKKMVRELIVKDGLHLDTQYERLEGTWKDGTPFYGSYRKGDFEKEVWDQHLDYTRENVLAVVNAYAVRKYDKIVLVEEETRRITQKVGGYREKSIVNNSWSYMQTTETWNDEHKVVRVTERNRTQTGYNCYQYLDGASFEVDLVTGKICG